MGSSVPVHVSEEEEDDLRPRHAATAKHWRAPSKPESCLPVRAGSGSRVHTSNCGPCQAPMTRLGVNPHSARPPRSCASRAAGEIRSIDRSGRRAREERRPAAEGNAFSPPLEDRQVGDKPRASLLMGHGLYSAADLSCCALLGQWPLSGWRAGACASC